MPLEKLIKGFKKFRASYFEDSDHYDHLIRNGQTPETLVIACSDSRNDPALMTQSKPGDIFVIRNVAAIVPPYQPDENYHGTSAAIEFAVKGLKVKNIIVLGHSSCGGVQALAGSAENLSDYEFIAPWINIGQEAKRAVESILPHAPRPIQLQALEQAVILTSLNNLMTFPWIKESIKAGRLTIHGWYFDMSKGILLDYDFADGIFKKVEKGVDGFSHHHDSGNCTACNWSLEQLVKKYT